VGSFTNLNQTTQFCDFIKYFPDNNSLLIIENPDSYNGKNEIIKTLLSIIWEGNQGEFLTFVGRMLKGKIETVNCEFRQIRNLIEVLKATIDKIYAKIDGSNVKKLTEDDQKRLDYYKYCLVRLEPEIPEELEQHVKEVSNYNDCDLLNKFYAELLKEFRSGNESLDRKYDFLLDAKMLHAIYRNQHKKYIFVCAGGTHIKIVAEILSKMNYREIMNLESADQRKYFRIEGRVENVSPVNIAECMKKILESDPLLRHSRVIRAIYENRTVLSGIAISAVLIYAYKNGYLRRIIGY